MRVDGVVNVGHRDILLRHCFGVEPNTDGKTTGEDDDVTNALHALHGVNKLRVGVVAQRDGVEELIGRNQGVQSQGQTRGLLNGNPLLGHIARQLGCSLCIAHVGELLVGVGIGTGGKDDVDVTGTIVGRGRVHVVHVWDTRELEFDGSRDRVRYFLSIGAGVGCSKVNGNGGDVRVLRDGETHQANDAQHRHDDGDNAANNRVFNEKWCHGSQLVSCW